MIDKSFLAVSLAIIFNIPLGASLQLLLLLLLWVALLLACSRAHRPPNPLAHVRCPL